MRTRIKRRGLRIEVAEMFWTMREIAKRCLGAVGYRVSRLYPDLVVENYLDGALSVALSYHQKRNTGITFVQIGGFDGFTGDPIHDFVTRFQWQGIICEPQPEAFAKLQNTYKNSPQVKLENVAIAAESGQQDFFYVKPNNRCLPSWVYQLGSFHREHITTESTGIANIEEVVVTRKVSCLSLVDLFNKYGLERLDLLQADTEGHDFQIVKSIAFDRIKPAIIHFEHRHLSLQDKAEAARLLVLHDYHLAFGRFDVLALLQQSTIGQVEGVAPCLC